MTLPGPLRTAIAALDGRVTLIIGAGTSIEAPTGGPTSRQLAEAAYQALLERGVLAQGDCANPEDLARLADAVVRKTGNQTGMVAALPVDHFRAAPPNRGHLVAAAMLRERALTAVVSLNFDMAMSGAVGQVGGASEIAIIASEADHERLGLKTVILLHGNAFFEPDRWVLTTVALERTWRGGWVDAIAKRVLSGPVTVFAGIGTRVDSLVESARELRRKIPEGSEIYNVDPAAYETSEFFASIGLPPGAYLRSGWCAFMEELSRVVTATHSAELQSLCQERADAAGVAHGEVVHLCAQLSQLGLLESGRVRARWLLSKAEYEPRHGSEPRFMADLLLAVERLEHASGRQARIHESGVVDFLDEGRVVTCVIMTSGRGVNGAIAIEAALSVNRYWRQHVPRPLYAVLSGIEGDLSAVAPPRDLARTERVDDLIEGGEEVEFVTLQMLRQNGDLARGIVA
jgi:hypothetical protein